jgi:hypothetical protein
VLGFSMDDMREFRSMELETVKVFFCDFDNDTDDPIGD